MSTTYISWSSITQGLTGVASKRKVRRQTIRQEQLQVERQAQKQKKQGQEKGQVQTKEPTCVKPVPIRYSAQNYEDYIDEYDDSCCSDSGCSEQPYDHDFFGMCVQRFGVYHGSKKKTQLKRKSAHSTKPKASGKDVYRLDKNSLSS
jgi:hypothetical protein